MDENYLDSLLSGVSTDKKPNKSFDNEVNMDAGIDIDLTDLDDISLDELDELDSLELGDLDIDDIDFDDVDVTNINPDNNIASKNEPVEDEDFSLEDLLQEEEAIPVAEESETEEFDLDSLFSEDNNIPKEEEVAKELDFDSMFSELSAEADDVGKGFDFGALDEGGSSNIDIDDLFSALGIEDEDSDKDSKSSEDDFAGNNDFDALFNSTPEPNIEDELADILDIDDVGSGAKAKKKATANKKKSFSEIIFGEPDEDDLEEEILYQQKKAAKKEKKAQKKSEREEKLAAKKEADDQKKQASRAKEQLKLKKKKDKEAALLAELEAEKNEKKVSNLTVVIVFVIFAALAVVVILGTQEFDYRQVIKKATDYFERDRYSLAYDEVAGVDVKEEDEELRDRIYTVMYVERLYESYENNMSMGRPDKALDALLRGLEKYDVHYAEAVELDIVEDIDLCKEKIVLALSAEFGLTEAEAYAIMELEGQAYSQALIEYSGDVEAGE